MNKVPEIKSLMQRAMKAYVVFSYICFDIPVHSIHFVVFDSNLAEAFASFREAYPDEDLLKLDIHCEL